MNVLPRDKQIAAISALTEGVSIRAVRLPCNFGLVRAMIAALITNPLNMPFARPYGLGLVLAAGIALAACTTVAEHESFPAYRFTDFDPIELDVAFVEIVEKYEPPMAPPNVDHLFLVTPGSAIQTWVKDRLRAVGARGRARATIVNASAVATELETNKNVKGYFINEQVKRFDANVVVVIEILDETNIVSGLALASSKRSRTIPEDTTLRDQDRFWYKLTDDLMTEFDREMELQIRRNLDRWVR